LIQDDQLSFELLQSVDCLYKEEYENDPMVRKLWYLVCYHLLPKINKEWKHCLEGSRILQPTFLYEKITTSDEAMTLWLIQNWLPKMKDYSEKGWPDNVKNKAKKGIKQGEQELRAGLQDYIKFHTLISDFKDKEQGMVACRWSDIFWEELVANNPKLFKKPNSKDQLENSHHLSEEIQGEVIVLPGIDNNNNHQSMNLLSCYNMRKALKTKNINVNKPLPRMNSPAKNGVLSNITNSSTIITNNTNKENNNNGTSIFTEHQITNIYHA
jgi:hypothetical protein